MQSLDLADVHGGLSALSEIAIAYKETIADPVKLEGYLRNVRWFFAVASDVPMMIFDRSTTGVQAPEACSREHPDDHA